MSKTQNYHKALIKGATPAQIKAAKAEYGKRWRACKLLGCPDAPSFYTILWEIFNHPGSSDGLIDAPLTPDQRRLARPASDTGSTKRRAARISFWEKGANLNVCESFYNKKMKHIFIHSAQPIGEQAVERHCSKQQRRANGG